MKILLYTYRMCHGGAERVAALWTKGFVKREHNVSILIEWCGFPITYGIPDGVSVYHNFLVHFSLRKFIPKFLRILYIRRIINKIKPDLIITVEPGLWKSAYKATKGKIPIIATDHNAFERPDYIKMPNYLYQHKFVDSDNYTHLTVLTEADRKVLIEKKGLEFCRKVSVLPNPVTFEPLKKVPVKEKFILATGRLDAWHYKGFDLLMKAWAKVQDKFPEWTLKIAGTGDNSYLKSICNELGILTRVEFLGFIEMKAVYERASVFVLSSRYEAFGMVLTEAMSQGCACIACDYKGRQREIIGDEVNGLLCPTDDIDALAVAIYKVIADDALRSELQKNAIERAKVFELPNIMKMWDEIFEKVGVK